MSADIHHLPGRMRVKVPDLRGNPALARALERSLMARRGVEEVEIRSQARSVIIHYDPVRVSAADLQAWLYQPDVTNSGMPAAENRPRPDARQESRLDLAALQDVPLSRAAIHLGKVFGKTAFKVALQQVVETGLSSAMRKI